MEAYMVTDKEVQSILQETDLGKAKEYVEGYTPEQLEDLLRKCLIGYGFNKETASSITHRLYLLDYFVAPASKGHHGAEPKCLFIHSFLMFLTLKKWTDMGLISWIRPESPLIVGNLHDLCKCDSYTPIYREEAVENRKSLVNVLDHYEYNKDQFPLEHHALASLVYAQQLHTLNSEEILCIRWHMGPYEGKEAWDGYDRAIRLTENVLWTHHADMYVSKVLGV